MSELESARWIFLAPRIIHHGATISALAVPGYARVAPVDAILRLGVPDGRSVVVKHPKAFLIIGKYCQVRLSRAKGLAVQHGRTKTLRRLNFAFQSQDTFNDVVV